MKKLSILIALITGISLNSSGQWTYSELFEPKGNLGATALGTKAYIGGGYNWTTHFTMVEIYDAATGTWNRDHNLSVARAVPATVSCGSKVFFAGGINLIDLSPISNVDIFDTLTQQWTLEHLSVPRVCIGAVSHGNKVLFAGGLRGGNELAYDIVDIYDIQTGQWSRVKLSEARDARAAAVVGDMAMFAGGGDFHHVSKRVDIYNFTTDTWSIDSLSVAREAAAIAVIGNKVLIAGGMTADNQMSDIVDIYDAGTGTWTTAALSCPRAFSVHCAAVVGTKAFFAGGARLNLPTIYYTAYFDVIDIYDAETDTWSVDHLSRPLVEGAVVAAGNKLIVAGGFNSSGVFSKVEIYTVPQTGVSSLIREDPLSVFPNPLTGKVKLNFTCRDEEQIRLEVLDPAGRILTVVADKLVIPGSHEFQWDAEGLPAGIYFYRMTILRASRSGNATGQRQTISGKLVKLYQSSSGH